MKEKGLWNYDDYTPEWIKSNIQRTKGIEVVTVDCINHPLNKQPHNMQLNTPQMYYRHPEYPFWVRSRNIDRSLMAVMKEDLEKEDFEALISNRVNTAYVFLCDCWYDTYEKDEHQRKSLIEVSKWL